MLTVMPTSRLTSPRTLRASRVTAYLLLFTTLTLTACLTLVACGTSSLTNPTTIPTDIPTDIPTKPTSTAPTRNPLGQGLDIINYPIDDSRGSVGRAFAVVADHPLPISPEAAALWKRQGLRFLAVPLAQLEPLLRDLPLAGSVQRQTFGPLTRWTPIAIGGSSNTSRIIAGLGSPTRNPSLNSNLTLPPGRLRILARAWDEPVLDQPANQSTTPATPRASLRLELLPQHEQADPDLTTFIQPPKRSIDRAGRVFDDLALAFLAKPDEAYLIIPESPAITWQRAEDASNDHPTPTPTLEPNTENTNPQPPTLGEVTLSNAAFSGSGRVKVIVVLIPRSAGVFNLLPFAR